MCRRNWKCVVEAGNVWYRLEMCGRGWKCVVEAGNEYVKSWHGVNGAGNVCLGGWKWV
jgi:hypothetical protein